MSSDEVSWRSIQNSLQRFKDGLPPLYTQLRDHIDSIGVARRDGDIKSLNREQIAASRTFKSLNHYLRELDEVENRLNICDRDKFRDHVHSLRQTAYDEIVSFVELDTSLDSEETPLMVNEPHQTRQSLICEQEPEDHAELLSLQAEQNSAADLKEMEAASRSWNQLQIDIQDVAEIMSKMSVMVHSQQDDLNSIEQHVELAKDHTSLGLLELVRSRRAKFAAVPVVGAVVGCVVGGPLGLLAGFKVAGVVTAVIGTYAGYKGGKFLKTKVNSDLEPDFVPGMLEAPRLGAYQEEDVSDEDNQSLDDSNRHFIGAKHSRVNR